MSTQGSFEITPKGLFVRPPLASTLLNSGFGTPRGSGVELGEMEAVYLILRGRIEVDNPEEVIKALSSRKRGFWTVYAVYADLSNQGRKIFYDDELGIILQREGEKMVYIPLSLDKPMTLKSLLARAKTYVERSWTPVLAIVDEHGTPTYYSVDTRPPSKKLLTSDEEGAP